MYWGALWDLESLQFNVARVPLQFRIFRRCDRRLQRSQQRPEGKRAGPRRGGEAVKVLELPEV